MLNPKHPIIQGRTNLPDGSDLYLSIWPAEKDRMFGGSGSVTTKNGGFRVEWEREFGGPLPKLQYKVKVLMLPKSQPHQTLALIGPKGEFMGGAEIERTKTGPEFTHTKIMVLGDGDAGPTMSEKYAARNADAKALVLSEWEIKLATATTLAAAEKCKVVDSTYVAVIHIEISMEQDFVSAGVRIEKFEPRFDSKSRIKQAVVAGNRAASEPGFCDSNFSDPAKRAQLRQFVNRLSR